jgi:uncharacterized membrane protein YdjX (TVP38/TMEM64 family)
VSGRFNAGTPAFHFQPTSSVARIFRRRARRDPTAVPKRRRKPRQPLRLAELPWGKIALFALVIGTISALIYSRHDIESVHRQAADFNAAVAFSLLVVLPLTGFPASLLHIAAGIRFGAPLGLALVSLSILIQVVVSHSIVRIWRRRFERAGWVKKIRERIPDGAHASVCVFTVLLPGVPYAAVNYILPVVGVPLRTFILCAWPLHSLRSTVTVIFGDQSAHLTATRLVVLIVYALLILGVSWWTYRRLQSQFSGPSQAADGRKQPA